MKLRPQKGNGGHVTSYNVTIGSREAREAGFLHEDGSPKPVKKTVIRKNIKSSSNWIRKPKGSNRQLLQPRTRRCKPTFWVEKFEPRFEPQRVQNRRKQETLRKEKWIKKTRKPL